MEFLDSDYTWDDTATLSQERQQRLDAVIQENLRRIEKLLPRFHRGRHIHATIPPDLFSTGTRGDRRVYAPVVVLFSDEPLSDDHIAELVQEIVTQCAISRAIYSVTHKVVMQPEGTVLVQRL